MKSLREALAAKRVRETVYPLAVADDTEARARLEEAKRRRLIVGVGKPDDDPAVVEAQAAVDAAQAEVDACYYPLRLRGIPPADLEALIAAHPPKPGAPEDAMWDKDSLLPHLVAACAVDSDLTAEEWAAEFASGRWTRGDVDALFLAAMSVCVKAVNADAVGKG